MMIDFALVAERQEGKSPADSIFEACMLRFSTDSDDHNGRVIRRGAAGLRHGYRFGVAKASGNHHRRRIDRGAKC